MHNAWVERHLVPDGHQERPERTASARRVAERVALKRPCAVGGVWAAGETVAAKDVTEAILRAHSARYYASLEAATARAATPDARVELTPAGDTMGCGDSLLAARAAVAISVEAVRRARHTACAACLVRPPGHHVARDGKTKVAPSQGFCLLNSVAIAALEAAAIGFERVAVVDFDVHHGNGTEDILGGDARFLFASVHAFGGGTYPGTGGKGKSCANVLNVPIKPPIRKGEFRRAVEKISRRVKAFGPDLLLLSAGFDGHRDDLADLGRLDEGDYGRCTALLLASCACPCVSILEGGYGRDCEGDDVVKPVGAGLALAIDDQRLQSFDACLEAHLDACADHFHGISAAATPPTPPAPASPLAVCRRLSGEGEE
jgi:acetoin utilization deacetylase AcuC-like enzyme